MKRTRKEIEDQIAEAIDAMDEGGRWPGMTYEEGVSAALQWVTGETDDAPMDND